MKPPTLSDWPQSSIDRLTEIIRKVIREELRGSQPKDDDLITLIRTQGVEAAKKVQHAKLREAK